MSYRPDITCAYLYTITLHGYPPKAADTCMHIAQMADMGFRSVELEGIGGGHLAAMFEHRNSIRDGLREWDLKVPVFCVVLPGLASVDSKIRSKAINDFRKGCELAAFFGASSVLDNGPLAPYAFPEDMPVMRHYEDDVLKSIGFAPNFRWDNYQDVLVSSIAKACDIASEYGLSYQLHPCAGSLTDTTDGFLLLDKMVNRSNLKFNLDTANLFFRRDNLALAVHKLANKLDYIHISDNNGTMTEHLPAGSGAIDWKVFFEALKKVGFGGHFSIDVGGAETKIDNIDQAYRTTADWLQNMIVEYGL